MTVRRRRTALRAPSLRITAPAASALAAISLALLLLPTAAAHAALLSAEPAANTRVERPPGRLVLHFTEAVEPRYTLVEVMDRADTHYEGPTTVDRDDPSRVTVELLPMPDGLYTVRWRALSVDTHTTSGLYLLAVNVPLGPAPIDHGNHTVHAVRAPSVGESTARGALFAGLIVAAGGPAALLLLQRGATPEPARTRRVLAVAAVGGAAAAAGAVALALYIAQRIEASLGDALSTRSGTWLAARAVAALVAAGLLWSAARARRGHEAATHPALARIILAAALALAALGSLAATSHAAARSPPDPSALAADAVHAVAVGLWVGGVVALLTLVRGAPAADARRIVLRFSPYAIALVVLGVATGVYSALLHVARVEDLVTTPYGLALSVKIAAVAVALAVAAVNRYVLLPRDPSASPRRLAAGVLAETLVLLVAVAAAGTLATASPPASPRETGGPPADEPQFQAVSGGYHFVVAVTPQPVQVGFQRLAVQVHPVAHALPPNATVYATITPTGGEPEIVPLDAQGPQWAVEGPLFTQSGTWRVDVVLQGKGTYVKVGFDLPVA